MCIGLSTFSIILFFVPIVRRGVHVLVVWNLLAKMVPNIYNPWSLSGVNGVIFYLAFGLAISILGKSMIAIELV